MRRKQKEQIVEFLKTFGQAHDEIKKNINNKNAEAAANLLVDCQGGAISLGTIIEKSEGEGFCTVSLLEEYCETTYQIYEKILAGEDITASKAYKLLNQIFMKIKNSVQNDIKVRKEVVFLPYKASMWDCFESVWQEADADSACDAYVVPIPYYDKNPDGSLGPIHYEGNEYPEDVPVIDYREFNLEARHPDIIYIHNPYDEHNFVTSVAPAYYAKKLKNYTDALVYIPYFVCVDDDVPEHFIILPGTIHAHKVIVQSEKVKEAYMEGFMKYARENNINPAVFGNLDEKFQASGSPKMDKVMSVKKKEVQVPEGWKPILENARKVVLYNTTIQAFLDSSDEYLGKMRRVFEVFRTNRSVALLWRPHPLMQETIKALHPEIYGQYVQLMNEYMEQGWGIYDNTPDIDRAIVMSDAYYGDMSSVVELYKATGKPIMIQNVNL